MKTSIKLSTILFGTAGLAGTALAQPGFSAAISVAALQNPSSTAGVDFSGDGLLDLVVTVDGPDRVHLFRNTGAGFVGGGAILLGAGVGAEDIAVGDFNGDGRMDLAITEHNAGRLQILDGIVGGFVMGVTVPSGAGSRSVRAADLNGDGRTDLFAVNRDANTATVALNGLLGWASATIPVGDEPRHAAAIDADGNGTMDLLVTNHRTRNATLLRNDGAGGMTFWQAINTSAAMRPDGIAAGDFNADGRADFAVTQDNNGVGFLSVFRNAGAGVFTGPTHYATGGSNTGDVVVWDFDHDGDLDAVAANQDSANISVLTNNGTGVFAMTSLLASAADPDGLFAADFDADGSMDFSIASRPGNTASVYMNTIPAPCGVDFNQDGTLDFFDYQDFVAAFEAGLPASDFNADGSIDFFDYNDFVTAFEAGC